jgi:hypothetical protein
MTIAGYRLTASKDLDPFRVRAGSRVGIQKNLHFRRTAV